MEKQIKSAVLLICFNRPDTTKIVFSSIRQIRPTKLYIAIDGPRDHKSQEKELCDEVLKITKKVDWPCEVKYLVRDKNLGCKLGVTQAITWALTDEDRIIIIEDDIVAEPSFFYFADQMLERYENDDTISMISANNYTPLKEYKADYLFSKYGHIWGWATWKRVWEKFDVEVPTLSSDVENGRLKEIALQSNELKYFSRFANRIKKLTDSGRINTWDYQFAYFRITNSFLSIVPKVNLASNIGINSSRTDNVGTINEDYYPSTNDFTAVNHPVKVECNMLYDDVHFKNHINKKPPISKRVLNKIFKK